MPLHVIEEGDSLEVAADPSEEPLPERQQPVLVVPYPLQDEDHGHRREQAQTAD